MAQGRPTLHHLNNSQSMRILWLIEELKVDYDLKLHERYKSGPKEMRAPDELKETHPLGKSPQLITAEGRVIIESSAIAKYLIDTYDTNKQFQGNPATGNDAIRDEVLSSLANASLVLVMMIEMMFEMVATRSPFFVRPLFNGARSMVHKAFTGPEIEGFFKYLENELGEQAYFMGENPGRADFMLSWPFDLGVARKLVDLKKYPKLDQWYARCHARDGWKRAIEKGNSYDL